MLTMYVLMMLTAGMGQTFDITAVSSFHTDRECQAALGREVERRSHLAHASGGYNYFRCDVWRGGLGGTGGG